MSRTEILSGGVGRLRDGVAGAHACKAAGSSTNSEEVRTTRASACDGPDMRNRRARARAGARGARADVSACGARCRFYGGTKKSAKPRRLAAAPRASHVPATAEGLLLPVGARTVGAARGGAAHSCNSVLCAVRVAQRRGSRRGLHRGARQQRRVASKRRGERRQLRFNRERATSCARTAVRCHKHRSTATRAQHPACTGETSPVPAAAREGAAGCVGLEARPATQRCTQNSRVQRGAALAGSGDSTMRHTRGQKPPVKGSRCALSAVRLAVQWLRSCCSVTSARARTVALMAACTPPRSTCGAPPPGRPPGWHVRV